MMGMGNNSNSHSLVMGTGKWYSLSEDSVAVFYRIKHTLTI